MNKLNTNRFKSYAAFYICLLCYTCGSIILATRNKITPFPTTAITRILENIFSSFFSLHLHCTQKTSSFHSHSFNFPITCLTALLLQTAWQLLMAELTAINGQRATCCSKCYSWYDSKSEMRICNFRPLEYRSLSPYSNTGVLYKTIYHVGFRFPQFPHLYFLPANTGLNVVSNSKLMRHPIESGWPNKKTNTFS